MDNEQQTLLWKGEYGFWHFFPLSSAGAVFAGTTTKCVPVIVIVYIELDLNSIWKLFNFSLWFPSQNYDFIDRSVTNFSYLKKYAKMFDLKFD